ncbi:hypothetical protein ATY81_25205 [Rhizobium sp. R72]|uniref:hypothetical protein n=1 Tax=unclassified Rhizobium TaxID=2613769 RepID=UPI000B52EA89|nr:MULTISPECIES: hypothetical protein [unclassified Rhizobium]OWW00099.1 hypothetical protein ATY81_25205 [Rhizobium sp. R72]OWW00490.1 hypothetical protein ATY80_25205 [Rhizobium sp. R711]
MASTLLILFAIGAACALRAPILIVTLILLAVMIAHAIASYSGGSTFLGSLGWGLVFAGSLEAGYLFTHGILYFLYVRGARRKV